MRRRRLWLALLAVTVFGVVMWLLWPASSAAVAAVKAKYERLRAGMSKEEVAAILGGHPSTRKKCTESGSITFSGT